jgi:hypothetical protein
MDTEGGGWTVIFLPTSSNFSSLNVAYTSSSARLLNDSNQVLLAYRDGTMATVFERAVFGMIQEWRVAAPFTYANMDVPIIVTVNGGSAVNGTLKFGNKSFLGDRCEDGWDTSVKWGRLCISGTQAPFYTSFAETVNDTCTDSMQAWNTRTCNANVRFTIAVR